MRSRIDLLRLLALLAAGVLAGIALVGWMQGLAGDENYYGPQVRLFTEGRFELAPGITMLPGYHAALATAMRPFGAYSDHLARMVNLSAGLLLVPLAWALARRYAPEDAPLKAAQVFFQPLLYPFFFLIYTEAWSLVALLAMLLAALRERYWLAALAGLVGTAMRQDFIVWVGFAHVLVALKDVEPARWRSSMRQIVRNAFGPGLPLLLVAAALVAFVVWNGSIAVADRGRHEGTLNLTNLYFFLLCLWLVFLPQNLHALPRILPLLRKPWVLVALAAGFAVYAATWSNRHIYNQEHLRFFLHNEALYWITREPVLRMLVFVPMAWAALTAITTPLPEWRLRALWVFAPLAAVLHPLVEQRYYLPAMLIFNLLRPATGARWEWATLLAYVPVALFLLCGIAWGAFFP